MIFRGWLPGEEDEHIPGRALGRVDRKDWGEAMLKFVIDDHHRVQEMAVLQPGRHEFGGGLVESDTCCLGHVVQEGDRALWRHVGAAEEGGHGVVDPIAMHALERWLTENGRCSDGTHVEEGADPVSGGVVQLGPLRDLDAVKDHGLENEQGLKGRVELQVVVDLCEATGLARVITLEILLGGEDEGLKFQAADATVTHI